VGIRDNGAVKGKTKCWGDGEKVREGGGCPSWELPMVKNLSSEKDEKGPQKNGRKTKEIPAKNRSSPREVEEKLPQPRARRRRNPRKAQKAISQRGVKRNSTVLWKGRTTQQKIRTELSEWGGKEGVQMGGGRI